jgi:hypothetical protein
VIIDESLEPTKGRSKFGVKLWVLAELVTGYIMHLNVYNERQQPILNQECKWDSFSTFNEFLLKIGKEISLAMFM